MIFSKLYKETDNCDATPGHLECRLSSEPAVPSHGQPGEPAGTGPVAERWQPSPQEGREPEGRLRRRFDPQPRLQRADPAGRSPAEPRWKRSAQVPAERSLRA